MPITDSVKRLQSVASVERIQVVRSALVERTRPLLPYVETARRAAGAVSALGWAVVVIGVVSWVAGWWLGWQELMVIAGACLLLVLVTGAFTLGRSAVQIEVRLEPPRVVAGDTSAGQITVTNTSSRRSLPCQVEVPVGEGMATFDVASLEHGEAVEELFLVPTEKRCVIPVGPARSVRGDPLGMFHRKAASSDAHALIVHPVTVALNQFGSGLLRDLEGKTTADISPSDLAFHALREYSPGDDRRHVHWRSSARTGRLLVRQFHDTRRSTLCAVVDGRPESYGDDDEFELALQVAGSIARRACRDGLSSVIAAGTEMATGVIPHLLLDCLSRAELNRRAPDLSMMVAKAAARRGDISYALIVSGSDRADQDLQRAASRFPLEVTVIAIRVSIGQPAGVTARGRATVLQLGALSDLPPLLRMEFGS